MVLDLTVAYMIALEERTEGWIAALQLVAFSMQGRDDIADFVVSSAGNARTSSTLWSGRYCRASPATSGALRTAVLRPHRLSARCRHRSERGKGSVEELDR